MKKKARGGWRMKADEIFGRMNAGISRYVHPSAVPYIVISVLVLAGIIGLMMSQGVITGLVTGPAAESYTDNVSMNFTGTQEHLWYPSEFGRLGSVKIDGRITGNGTAKIWLVTENDIYLVLDSDRLDEMEYLPGVVKGDIGVGDVVESDLSDEEAAMLEEEIEQVIAEGENASDEAVNDTVDEAANETVNENVVEEDEAEEVAEDIAEEEDEVIEEPAVEVDAVPPEDATIDIQIGYASGTSFDTDDDGVEEYDGVVDLEISDIDFSWNVNESYLCTKWIVVNEDDGSNESACYGNQRCCGFVDLESAASEWDMPYYSYKGLDGAGENNTISAQVLYVDYNLSSENLYSYIHYSDESDLAVSFMPASAKVFEFREACIDTCELDGLDEPHYKFRIETDEGAVFELRSISYGIISESSLDENVTVDFTVMDADENEIQATIRVYDSNTGESEVSHRTDNVKREIRDMLMEEEKEKNNISVKRGLKDIKIRPKDRRVESIDIEDAQVDSDVSQFIRIDDLSAEPGDTGEEPSKIYAIDMTAINFTEAIVVAKASENADKLLKCVSYNFTLRECDNFNCSDEDEEAGLCEQNAMWMPVRDLMPGEYYSFVVNMTDPAYYESYESVGENRTISDVYVNKLSRDFIVNRTGDYLILSSAEATADTTSYSVNVRTTLDGETISEANWEPKDADWYDDYQTYFMHKVVQLENGTSHTAEIDWMLEDDRCYAAIRNARAIVIDLADHEVVEVEGTVSLDASYSDVAVLTFTPGEAGDYLMIATGEYASESSQRSVYVDMEIDGIETDEAVYESKDYSDYKPFGFHKMENLDTSEHTIKVRAKGEESGYGEVRRVRIVAIRMTDDFDAHSVENGELIDTSSYCYSCEAYIEYGPDDPLVDECNYHGCENEVGIEWQWGCCRRHNSCSLDCCEHYGCDSVNGSSSDGYITAAVLDVNASEAVNYTILATAQISGSSSTYSAIATLEIDGTAYADMRFEPKETSSPRDMASFATAQNIEFGAGYHNVSLKIRSESSHASAYMRNARLTAIRVTPVEEEEVLEAMNLTVNMSGDYDVIAIKTYDPDVWYDAMIRIEEDGVLTLPQAMDVIEGLSGNHTATFTIAGSVNESYTYNGSGVAYEMESEIVLSVNEGDVLVLHIDDGDESAGMTKVGASMHFERPGDYPSIFVISPVENYTYPYGSNATIKANLSGSYGIDTAVVNITWNDSYEELLLEKIDDSTFYSAVFINMSYVGSYSYQFIVNNTAGLVNDDVYGSFNVCGNCTQTQEIWINIINSTDVTNQSVIVTWLEDGGVELVFPDIPVAVDYADSPYITPPVLRIVFYGLRSNLTPLNVGIDYPFDYYNSPVMDMEQIYALDFSEIDHDYAVVTVRARGETVYKCPGWNFSTRVCENEGANWGNHTAGVKDSKEGDGTTGWISLTDVAEGTDEYTFTLYPGDPGFIEDGAAYCTTSPCIATSDMIKSVDNAGGIAEFNAPNTIDSCTDGVNGTYLTDESIENITVTSLNRSVFRTNDTVNIKATVHCWNDGANDNINFVYTNITENPQWRVIGSVDPCPAGGMNEVEINHTLDDVDGNQTIRMVIQYDGSVVDTCGTGDYDDNDDISFRVYNGSMPTSSQPSDIDIDIGADAVIRWQLSDMGTGGSYYVEKDGALFAGPYSWSSGDTVSVRADTHFIGVSNYTIHFNNTEGYDGIPDEVMVTVYDAYNLSCEDVIDMNDMDGVPVFKTINIDGDMSDWVTVMLNPKNTLEDLSESAGDNDTGMTADRDVILFAYTWNDERLFFYLNRLVSGANILNLLVYMDMDNDGYMNSSDYVARFAWSGTTQRYDSWIYNYVPAGSADILYGSGYDMPGSVSLIGMMDDNVFGGAANGIEVEMAVNWSSLGLSVPQPITMKLSSSRGANLPSQIEDNMGVVSSQYSSWIFMPEEQEKPARSGSTAYYVHTLQNCGLSSDSVNLSDLSSQGYNVTLYSMNSSMLQDGDGDGYPDVSLEPGNHTRIVAGIDVPISAVSGTIDETTINAVPEQDSSVAYDVTDMTVIGDIVILSNSRSVTGAPGMLGTYNFTIYNMQPVPDVLDIASDSSHNWDVNAYHMNGTPLTDTDSDSDPDVGTLQPESSIDIYVTIMIPSNLKKDVTDTMTLTATSSNSPSTSADAYVMISTSKRIAISPDYTRSVGIGQDTYYELNISNNWNDSDIVDVSYVTVNGWNVTLLEADLTTPLSDSDGDGIPDVNMTEGYGAQEIIYMLVEVPDVAVDGDSDTVMVYANSSNMPSAYDTAQITTFARVVVTYDSAVRNKEESYFSGGQTVYSRAHSLNVHDVYFVWIDSNSTVVRTSPDIPVTSKDEADDEYALDLMAQPGGWTLIVFDAQRDIEQGRAIFYVTEDVVPNVTAISPDDNQTSGEGLVNISCNATDNYELANISLYITDESAQNYELNSTSNVSGQYAVSHTMLNLVSGTYVWGCSAQDYWGNTGWSQNRTLNVAGGALNKTILYSPANGTSEPVLRPVFIWYNASDPGDDNLTYQLQVDDFPDFSSALEVNVTGIEEGDNLTNYTLLSDLDADMQYYWRVRAYDGMIYGEWSDIWEYYAEGVVSLRLLVDSVSFGELEGGMMDNTTDDLPMPFIIENDGSVDIDIEANATASLWDAVGLDSEYFMFRIDDRNETGAFNASASMMSWEYFTATNKAAISRLSHDDMNDTAVVDIGIMVPSDEPAGTKTTTINFMAAGSS